MRVFVCAPAQTTSTYYSPLILRAMATPLIAGSHLSGMLMHCRNQTIHAYTDVYRKATPRRHTSKACEYCRQRKQKCNGLDPCNVCLGRALPCSYRTVIRQRHRRRISSSRVQQGTAQSFPGVPASSSSTIEPSSASSLDPQSQSGSVATMLMRHHIFNSVRVIDINDSSEFVYGPSANVPLIRHFHAHLDSALSGEAGKNCYGVYQEVDDDPSTYRRTTPAPLGEDLGPEAGLVFARYEIAQSLIGIFLRTTQHAFPILDPEELSNSFERLYDLTNNHQPHRAEKAVILAAMAIGLAQSSPQCGTNNFLVMARSELGRAGNTLSYRAVQAELLLISDSSLT